MKENTNIDDLLNGFIDGELTQRQLTEVQRLVAHDTTVVERLNQLQKCKQLVNALPRAEAPADMTERIKTSLERRTLLGQGEHEVAFDQRQGARHLQIRRILSAAAMILLLAVFGIVIYTIIGPDSSPDSHYVVESPYKPAEKVKPQKPAPVMVAEKKEPAPAILEFNTKLELKTKAFVAIDTFIENAIDDNSLVQKVGLKAATYKSAYSLTCSREGLSSLMADLASIWNEFDSANLSVATEKADSQFIIKDVTAEQIAEIARQDDFQKSIKLAKDFAVLNDLGRSLPGKEVILAAKGKRPALVTIPKPVLTSSEKTIKKPTKWEDSEKINLTIIVLGND